MTKGPKGSSPRNAGAMRSGRTSHIRSRPSQLGTKPGLITSGLFANRRMTKSPSQFTGEPPRASLTDPPAGYQTPSPNEVYGQAKEVYKPKVDNYYETHGDKRSAITLGRESAAGVCAQFKEQIMRRGG